MIDCDVLIGWWCVRVVGLTVFVCYIHTGKPDITDHCTDQPMCTAYCMVSIVYGTP